ncbi:hypothetical protein [uncultured Winogradskyella sp.]|uniref:hypothetical protein n=1 Tax=uncultured Winogradskyella sp. TaxID=395353 RepID=UPI002628EEDD|nr:hypothetical protein [uncultured Winogradskyella sp.]
MERQDYTTLKSHYIPNEKKYHFIFPLKILYEYDGIDNLDVTIDDNIAYFIIEPILRNEIEYDFEFIWTKNDINKNPNSLDICVKLNDDKFDPQIVIDNLENQKMINGLELYKEEYGKLNKIFEKK